MTKTVTSSYDVAEHVRTPEEMTAYLEASVEEADGNAEYIAKALGGVACAKRACRKSPVMLACRVRASTRHSPENAIRPWTRFSDRGRVKAS